MKGILLKINWLCFCLFAILSNRSYAATHAGIEVQKISNQLAVLSTEYGTNIGIVNSANGLLLIDPMPGNTYLKKLEKSIEALFNVSVKHIVNTHGHSDHTGGNEYFINRGAQYLKGNLDDYDIKQEIVGSHSSKDHIYFHRASNSIFVGDVFDSSWHPTFYFDGLRGLDAAVDTILAFGNETSLIIPGHGKIADKEALRKFRKHTHEWVTRVKEMLSIDMTVEQIMIDRKANDILLKFNTAKSESFLPIKAHRRFIERTITLLNKKPV